MDLFESRQNQSMEVLKSLEHPCINKFANIMMSTSVLWHKWKFVLCLQLSFNQPGDRCEDKYLVPGAVCTQGVNIQRCQYLRVSMPGGTGTWGSLPGGVGTWGGGPWRCWYLGVQVTGILVPRHVGTSWCWYLGYQ